MSDVLCGLWTEHRVNSRNEGFKDYRDSPPTSSMLSALGPGTLIVETSDPGDPCVHVLRCTGTYEELAVQLDRLHDDGGWEVWLSEWKAAQAIVARALVAGDLGRFDRVVAEFKGKRPSVETLRIRFRQAWESTAARVRAPLYLVGSYLTDPEGALDIDIVAALGEDDRPRWFDKLRAQAKLSALLSAEIGLPIDFKVQNGIQFAGLAAEASAPPVLLAKPGVAVEPWEDETVKMRALLKRWAEWDVNCLCVDEQGSLTPPTLELLRGES